MKFDPREHDALQQAQTAQVRFDMYTGIHKALRLAMGQTLAALGAMDPADAASRDAVLGELRGLLHILRGHVEHENTHVHTAIEARAPGQSAALAAEHVDHITALASLELRAAAVQACPEGEHAALALLLYREFALFVADNLVHMAEEESRHNALLWALYSDEELLQIHDRLVGSIPPQEMAQIARYMVPGLSHPERVALFQGLRASAPEPAVQALLEVAQSRLGLQDWTRLTRALGLPQVPGLVAMR